MKALTQVDNWATQSTLRRTDSILNSNNPSTVGKRDNWSSYNNRVYLMTMADLPSGITEFDDFVHAIYIYKLKEHVDIEVYN